MSRQIKGLLYFFITNFRYSFLIFWSILTGVLVLSLIISYFLLNLDEAIYAFGFPFGTYFHVSFLGFLIVKEGIPFALKVGATRKNIFLAIGIFFLGVALFQAVIANTVQFAAQLFVDAVDIHTFMFMHPAQLIGSENWLTMIFIDTAMMFLLLAAFFVLGLLFYRGGLVVGGGIIGILAIGLLLSIAQGWIIDYFIELYHTIDLVYFIQVLGIGVVLYGLAYFLVRTITTVKVG